MAKQIKKKLELPPKFEIAQLIALQIGIGLVVLYFILKTEEVVKLFGEIPKDIIDGTKVLLFIKIIDMLCAFFCIVISGGKSIKFYSDLKSFIELKKKLEEKDE